MPTYKDSKDAEQQLFAAFSPTNDAQRQAISSVASLVPTAPITSQTLTPTPSLDYKRPTQMPAYPVAALDANIQAPSLTPQEQKQSTLLDRVQSLNEKLTGESAYRTQLETDAGIPDLIKTQTDLAAQLKNIQAEAAASTLKAEDRLAPMGAIVGEQAQVERNRAVRALTTSSLLEASRGNLTTSLALIDRAVGQKYDPIKSEIETSLKNLDLIIKDPRTTVERANRANQEKAVQEARAASVEAEAQNAKDILGIATAAAKNGANAYTLQKMQGAKTPMEALEIAVAAGVLQEPVKPSFDTVKLDNGTTVVIDKNTGQQVRSLGGAGATSGAGTGNMSGTSSPVADTWAQSVLSGRAKLSDVPAALKSAVLMSIDANGGQLPRNLNATQQTAANNANDALLSLNTMKDILLKDDGSINRTALNLSSVPFGLGNRTLYTARNNVVDVISRIRTGAALTESEQSFYKDQAPNFKDDDATIKKKINQLAAFYSGISGTPVTVTSPTGEEYVYDDLFDQAKRYELRQAIQEGYTVTNF